MDILQWPHIGLTLLVVVVILLDAIALIKADRFTRNSDRDKPLTDSDRRI